MGDRGEPGLHGRAAAQQGPAQIFRIGLVSARFLLAVGDLLIGWLPLRHADVALAAIDAGGGTHFYETDIAAV
ncbi:acyl-CoA dehydrogenase C-terminal domain-containing protein [Nocardia jiangxiensis]|uniref:Acyl-CoA dehydrogenase C-terminal domain-containing protein n=1 Tax=Nocardia jiangxiensis TaxID=282685 RepID=A0ABW6S7I4_9NOCA